jgi:hypothetical protein
LEAKDFSVIYTYLVRGSRHHCQKARLFDVLGEVWPVSLTSCPRRSGLEIFDRLVVLTSIVSYFHTHHDSTSLFSRTGYVGLCDTMPVDFPCNLSIWPYRIYSNLSISPHAFLYKYRAIRALLSLASYILSLFIYSDGPGFPNQPFF